MKNTDRSWARGNKAQQNYPIRPDRDFARELALVAHRYASQKANLKEVSDAYRDFWAEALKYPS